MDYVRNYFNKKSNLKRPYRLEIIGDTKNLKKFLETAQINNNNNIDLGTVECIDFIFKNGKFILRDDSDEDEIILGKVVFFLWTKHPNSFFKNQLELWKDFYTIEFKLITDIKVLENDNVIMKKDSLIKNQLLKYTKMKNDIILQSFSV